MSTEWKKFAVFLAKEKPYVLIKLHSICCECTSINVHTPAKLIPLNTWVTVRATQNSKKIFLVYLKYSITVPKTLHL